MILSHTLSQTFCLADGGIEARTGNIEEVLMMEWNSGCIVGHERSGEYGDQICVLLLVGRMWSLLHDVIRVGVEFASFLEVMATK